MQRGARGALLAGLLAAAAGAGGLLVHGAAAGGGGAECAAGSAVASGDEFPLGVAFWPGGSADNWLGLHPCRPDDRAKMAEAGVRFAFFRSRAGSMSMLGMSRVQQEEMVSGIAPEAPQIMTAVAFTNSVRSEARTVYSGDSGITGGMGRVDQLNLVAVLDRGEALYLQWYDPTCFACGGKGDTRCIDRAYCATDEGYCNGEKELPPSLTGENTPPCRLTVFLAFSGDDRNALPLKSAGQIQQLDKLSASKLFVKGTQKGIEGAQGVAESAKEVAEKVKDVVT